MSIDESNSEEKESFELTIREEDFWLNDAFKGLQSAYQKNKFPHGLLINASKGFGQLQLAKAVGASLLCNKNQVEVNETGVAVSQLNLSAACGRCKSCLLLKAYTHPDFYLAERLVEKGKLKQNISIDQMRALSQKLVQTSQMNGWRVAIINSIDDMNISSFNAILKTLEEPGQNTVIMLISQGMGKVPATIKSRCQMLNLKADKNKTLDWLIDKNLSQINDGQIDDDKASNAIEVCYGAPYASLEFIVQGYQNKYNKLFIDLDAILSNHLSANELLVQHKEYTFSLIAWIANYFHQVSQAICLEPTSLEPISLEPASLEKAQRYKNVPQKIVTNLYQQIINLNRAQSSGSNLQLTLQLEAILIHWFELGRKIVHYSNR